MKIKPILLLISLLPLIAVAVLAYKNQQNAMDISIVKMNNGNSKPVANNQHKSNHSKPVSPTNQTSSVTVYFDNYGFDPNLISVPIGETVNFKNISTIGPIYLEAVDWKGYPEYGSPFDLGEISEGMSKSMKVTTNGVWQYEANNNPSLRGEIGSGAVSVKPYVYPNADIHSTTLKMVYDIFGFMPNEVSVPVGTTITLKNITNNIAQPGPSLFKELPGEQPSNPSLDLGILNKQQSKSFTLATIGRWHLDNVDQPRNKALSLISVHS
ncbi:MAG: cupredoxin domain-containing protein [Candidatus Saccharimonadales bacterium]